MKIGVDDFLCHYTLDEFKALPNSEIKKQTLQEMIHGATLETLSEILKRLAHLKETERAFHINALAKKLNIPKRAIQKDLETLNPKKKETVDIDRLLESGAEVHSKFSAQNFYDGRLSIGAVLGDAKVLIRADGEIILSDGENHFRFTRSRLTPEAMKRFRAGDEVNGQDLLQRLTRLFSDHVVFRDNRIPTLLSIWIIGTYLFKVFRFYGYLLFISPVKRCGKSLALDILSLVCFNATPRMVNPSEASVFREVDSNDATLIIDEVESLSEGEREKKAEMISLLNAGFQRGAQASRVETRGKEFVVVYYNAYSPKVLAGIKGVVDTVEDRAFKISMVRKAKSETVKRLNLRLLESDIESIREDLHLWAIRYAGDVAEVYDSVLEFPGTEGLDDREKDIIEPLLSIASVIDAQANDETIPTVKTLINLAGDMGKGRMDQEQLDGAIPAVVSLMKEMIDGVEERFKSADELFSRFPTEEDLGFIQSKRGLSLFLSKLELYRTSPRWIQGKTVRGYLITRRWVEDLQARYA